MKGLAILGIVLLLLGVIVLINEGISYRTREKVLDIGPIEAHQTVQKTIPISPVLGVLMLAGGATMVVFGFKRA